jgi:hypothetical protein
MTSRRCFHDITRPSRRDFLELSLPLSAVGASLWLGINSASAAEEPASKKANPRIKRCILVWLDGGPSHLELLDPKPDAPAEVRGPLLSISTKLAGIRLGEVLPRMAERLDRCTLVRSITSPLGEHNLATHYSLTGHKPTGAVDYPTFTSTMAHLDQSSAILPRHIAIPHHQVGGTMLRAEGFLGAKARPYELHRDKKEPDSLVTSNLTLPDSLTRMRVDRRREYLGLLEQSKKSRDANEPADAALSPAARQAFEMLTSPAAREAFQIDQEKPATHARYGDRLIGQSLLLARRLIERDVPLVTVNQLGWDTHNDLALRLRDGYAGAKVGVGLAPLLDQGLAALLDDLVERELFDETLVLVMGEFGRTPKINVEGGRDHWPRVFSALLFGGGVPQGMVVGSSDKHGESPADNPVTPADLVATIYQLMGVDPKRKLRTPDGRDVSLSENGSVIREIAGT